MMALPPPLVWRETVVMALREDLGRRGDVTSRALFPPDRTCRAVFAARREGVLCGLEIARHVFALCEPSVRFSPETADGEAVKAGQILAAVEGPAIGILEGERTALNFLSHLSGIATETKAFVDLIAGTKARVACTRKTTPGLRLFEKYAVSCGGGANHRFGLDDAILIKDNHIAVAGGVGPAIQAARKAAGHMMKIEVEIETMDQFMEALSYDIDAVLLDNWAVSDLPEAVARSAGNIFIEASGGISRETIRAVAESGVDLISVGGLTHSAPALDIGLDIES